MKHTLRVSKGFTLIELMITIAIIGILAAIAIPSYSHYITRARYGEIIQAAAPYKVGVAECFSEKGGTVALLTTTGPTGCSTNATGNHIPENVTADVGNVSSVEVLNGIITVTPTTTYFATGDTYILRPHVQGTAPNSKIVWEVAGGGPAKGYAPAGDIASTT